MRPLFLLVLAVTACTPATPEGVVSPPVEVAARIQGISVADRVVCWHLEAGEAECEQWEPGGGPPSAASGPVRIPGPPGVVADVDALGPCAISESSECTPMFTEDAGQPAFTELPDGLVQFELSWNHAGTEPGPWGCGIEPSGGLVCWGNRPAAVPASIDGTYHDLSVTRDGVCALTTMGVACWSALLDVQLDVPTRPFVQVEALHDAACGLDSAGAVTCWGAGADDIDTDALVDIVAISGESRLIVGDGERVWTASDDSTSFDLEFPEFTSMSADGNTLVCVAGDAGRSCNVYPGLPPLP